MDKGEFHYYKANRHSVSLSFYLIQDGVVHWNPIPTVVNDVNDYIWGTILPLISVLAVSDLNYVFQLCFGLVVPVYINQIVLCLRCVTWLQLQGLRRTVVCNVSLANLLGSVFRMVSLLYMRYALMWGHTVVQWLKHCTTNRKVAGSIPDGVVGIFHWHNPSGRIMALGST
jgi:hypothetical protein